MVALFLWGHDYQCGPTPLYAVPALMVCQVYSWIQHNFVAESNNPVSFSGVGTCTYWAELQRKKNISFCKIFPQDCNGVRNGWELRWGETVSGKLESYCALYIWVECLATMRRGGKMWRPALGVGSGECISWSEPIVQIIQVHLKWKLELL